LSDEPEDDTQEDFLIPEPDNVVCHYISHPETTHEERRRVIAMTSAIESSTPPEKLVLVARQVELFLSGQLAVLETYAPGVNVTPLRKQ